jgi:hypothetical protein
VYVCCATGLALVTAAAPAAVPGLVLAPLPPLFPPPFAFAFAVVVVAA